MINEHYYYQYLILQLVFHFLNDIYLHLQQHLLVYQILALNFNKIVSEMDFFNTDEDAVDEEANDELMDTLRTKTQVVTELEEEPFEA